MSATDIVKDPDLRSVLEAAEHAQHQCNVMLNFLDEHSSSRQSFSSSSTTSDGISPKEIEAAFTKYQKVLFARLSQVRGLNRNAIMGVRQTKQATAEARQEIDTLHLRLQNLYYEQHHLKGEIAACEGYDHKYQQLPLLSVEEFLEKQPEHASDDENQLMIARINHEHDERQMLEERRQGLLKKKQGLIADNNKRKENLANLDKDLEKFIEAAIPIQNTFEKEY